MTPSTDHLADAPVAPPAVDVTIAGDDLTRRRLRSAAARAGVRISAALAGLPELISTSRELGTRVAVLGSDPGRLDAADLRTLRARPAALRVLMVVPSEPRAVREAMRAGVDGCLFETDIEHALAPTVAALAVGQLCFPPGARFQVTPPLLSHREKQMLALVAHGLTNLEIAGDLYLAESTVKCHLVTCFRKLGVRTRKEASAAVLDADTQQLLGMANLLGGSRVEVVARVRDGA